jgi:hypothetical protein
VSGKRYNVESNGFTGKVVPVNPTRRRFRPRGAWLSSQSGGLGLALLDYAAKPNLGISTFVRQQGRCLRQRFDPVLSRGPASQNPATFRFIQSRRLAPVAETIAQEANGEGGWALGSVSARLLQVARRPVTVVRVGAVGAPCATTGRG